MKADLNVTEWGESGGLREKHFVADMIIGHRDNEARSLESSSFYNHFPTDLLSSHSLKKKHPIIFAE